jgi:hypothetical protein
VSYGPPPGPPLLAASVKTGPRVGLILWGLIVAVFGAWIMAASAGVAIDAQLALILILAISGLALIVSAVIAALRRPRP